MRSPITVALLALSACWHATDAPPDPPAPIARQGRRVPTGPLALEVLVSTPHIAMATRERVEVGLRATNLTHAPFDPGLHSCELLVNGEPSVDFRAAVGNGSFEPEWTWLPAGQSVAMTRPLGDLLFDHPGPYTLVLRLGSASSNAVQVRVDP